MRTLLVAATLAFGLASQLSAQKPDFSGSWTLDPTQSDSMPPMGGRMAGPPNGSPPAGERGGGRGMMAPAEVFITQMSTRMTIEQKLGERARTLTYALDGSESRNPGMMGNDMSTTSSWVDNTIVTKGKNTVKTPMGEMTIETNEVRALSEDGKTMTVTMTVASPRGTMTRKLVYLKK